METLFSYGTLQKTEVQIESFNRKLIGSSDCLFGYIVSKIKIMDANIIKLSGTDLHPALIYTGNDGDKVNGVAYQVTINELVKADEYEVDDYKRVRVTLFSGQNAWVYISH